MAALPSPRVRRTAQNTQYALVMSLYSFTSAFGVFLSLSLTLA